MVALFRNIETNQPQGILAEPDAEKETQSCASRWHSAGREVLITRAVGGGAKDANDIIMAVRA